MNKSKKSERLKTFAPKIKSNEASNGDKKQALPEPENKSHREDFESLLDIASLKKKTGS